MGEPNPEKVGAEGWVPDGWGPEGWAPEGWARIVRPKGRRGLEGWWPKISRFE